MCKKRNDKESTICLAPQTSQIFFINSKKDFFQKRSFLKKRRRGGFTKTKQRKEGFLISLATAIKGPTILIRKYANELIVHEKTVRTAIKQDLSPDLKTLDYAKRGVLENKANAIFPLYISSLKTAIENEWNKMSEEFILKSCLSF